VPNISQITLPATSPTGGLDRNAPPQLIIVIMVIVINKGESKNKKPFCKTVYY
jgi:hypothetical protein